MIVLLTFCALGHFAFDWFLQIYVFFLFLFLFLFFWFCFLVFLKICLLCCFFIIYRINQCILIWHHCAFLCSLILSILINDTIFRFFYYYYIFLLVFILLQFFFLFIFIFLFLFYLSMYFSIRLFSLSRIFVFVGLYICISNFDKHNQSFLLFYSCFLFVFFLFHFFYYFLFFIFIFIFLFFYFLLQLVIHNRLL